MLFLQGPVFSAREGEYSRLTCISPGGKPAANVSIYLSIYILNIPLCLFISIFLHTDLFYMYDFKCLSFFFYLFIYNGFYLSTYCLFIVFNVRLKPGLRNISFSICVVVFEYELIFFIWKTGFNRIIQLIYNLLKSYWNLLWIF